MDSKNGGKLGHGQPDFIPNKTNFFPLDMDSHDFFLRMQYYVVKLYAVLDDNTTSRDTLQERTIIMESRATNQLSNLVPKQVQRGQIIRVGRGLYWHYGVCLGHGRVAAFGTPFKTSGVREYSAREFAGGGRIEIAPVHPVFSLEEVALRAESRIGTGTYSILHSNCEHFARWAATNRWKSEQVESAAALAGVAAGIAMLGILVNLQTRRA